MKKDKLEEEEHTCDYGAGDICCPGCYKLGKQARESEILEMIDELLEESKRLKEYGWIDGVELKTTLKEKLK